MPPSAVQNSQGHYMAAYEAGNGMQGYNANAKHHSLHRKTPGERVSDITRLLQVGYRERRPWESLSCNTCRPARTTVEGMGGNLAVLDQTTFITS